MFQQDYNISARKEFPPHILRIAKIAKQKSKINSKAKTEQNQRQTVQPPYLKLKKKRGAPKGNSNAFKTALHTAEAVEMRRQVRACIVQTKRVIAAYNLYAAMKNVGSASMRRAVAQASNQAAAKTALR
jgi:hypothetical protein